MHVHHRQHENQHDQEDRAENGMSAATLELASESDHKRRMLQDFPANRALTGTALIADTATRAQRP